MVNCKENDIAPLNERFSYYIWNKIVIIHKNNCANI